MNIFIVDGDNVAIGEDGKASIARIFAIHHYLSQFGEPITVVCRRLRGGIRDQTAYEQLFRKIAIHEAPTGDESDETLLLLAKATGGIPISNDRFREYEEELGDITARRMGFMIAKVQGELQVIIPKLRNGTHPMTNQETRNSAEVKV